MYGAVRKFCHIFSYVKIKTMNEEIHDCHFKSTHLNNVPIAHSGERTHCYSHIQAYHFDLCAINVNITLQYFQEI